MADLVRAIGDVVGAARQAPEVNRPPGVVYAKCGLKLSLGLPWTIGAAYIIGKYIADPQKMITIFQNVALPAGVILMGMTIGCVKLSLQADSLSSLEELWKRYIMGVLEEDIRKVLLTPDVLQFAEAGQNVELEVQIDERIYKEACLDLMVRMILQNSENTSTSLSRRRSLSESNLQNLVSVNSSKSNKELFLQAKPQAQPKIIDKERQSSSQGRGKTPARLPFRAMFFPESTSGLFFESGFGPVDAEKVPDVCFLDIDDDKVFEKMQIKGIGLSQQHIRNGTVHMVATPQSTSQISDIKVWVFREPAAAILYDDKQGRQQLPVKMEKSSFFKTNFSVNLNDVYTGKEGRPFYKLAKVDIKRQNVFQLSSLLYFNDGTVSEEFFSKPFHLITGNKKIPTDEPLSPPTTSTSISSVSSSPDLRDNYIRLETLVSDQVVASSVECGMILNMTSEPDMVKAREKTRTDTSFSCANFVTVDKLIAQQIICKSIKTDDTQRPPVDMSGGTTRGETPSRKRAKITESTSKDETGYVEESKSHIITKTIMVELLIVDHLSCDQIITSQH